MRGRREITNLGDKEGRCDVAKPTFALISIAEASFLTRIKIQGLERHVDLRIYVLKDARRCALCNANVKTRASMCP